MTDLTTSLASKLASRPRTRRGFIIFAGQAALGLALALNGSSLALADSCPCVCSTICPCVGCGDTCNNCSNAGGCGAGCLSGQDWFCCVNGCIMECSECCCGGTACHCFTFNGSSCGSGGCLGGRPPTKPNTAPAKAA